MAPLGKVLYQGFKGLSVLMLDGQFGQKKIMQRFFIWSLERKGWVAEGLMMSTSRTQAYFPFSDLQEHTWCSCANKFLWRERLNDSLGSYKTVGIWDRARMYVGVPIAMSVFFSAHHAPSLRYHLIALMMNESNTGLEMGQIGASDWCQTQGTLKDHRGYQRQQRLHDAACSWEMPKPWEDS